MTPKVQLLPGTLDILILKAVSLGKLHGYGVLLRIEQISGGALEIQQGALYPALYRLEHQGLIAGEWGTSDNNRRAKYYRLTAAGRKRALYMHLTLVPPAASGLARKRRAGTSSSMRSHVPSRPRLSKRDDLALALARTLALAGRRAHARPRRRDAGGVRAPYRDACG